MLVQCPECGHQVSDRASACPQCGFDFRAEREDRNARVQMAAKKKEEAKQASLQRQQYAAFVEQFRPNAGYLSAPWPLKPLFRPLVFTARSPRIEFWSYTIFYLVSLAIAVGLCSGSSSFMPLVIPVMLYETLCWFSVETRRGHDVQSESINGCSYLLAFVCLLIPIIGWIVFLTLFVQGLGWFEETYPCDNKYGPNPFFYYRSVETLSRTNELEQTKSVGISDSRPQGGSLTNIEADDACVVYQFMCPSCGGMVESEVEPVVGQHAVCPHCLVKFTITSD